MFIFLLSSFQKSIFYLRKQFLKTKQNKLNNSFKLFFRYFYVTPYLEWRVLLRKEVIHPHVPVGIPCYDLTPIISPTLGMRLLSVTYTTSGIANSHGLTGGVYKARERIHRDLADSRLLAIPASWSRVADFNPNWERLFEVCLTSPSRFSLYRPL